MARPKKDIHELKAIRVNIRMTVDEYLILSDNAKTVGITIPDYIRRRVTGRVLPRKRISPEDRQLFVELSRIGNNVNQLTKKIHLGMNDRGNLHEQLMELKNVLNAIKSNIVNNAS
nr:plasmid mobilization relaxosome protein MobC [uncultured Allomuricauda sp.]